MFHNMQNLIKILNFWAKNSGVVGLRGKRSFLEENGQTPNAPVAVYCATENFLPKRKFVGVNKGNYSL